jgi:hypothetical protein
MTTIPYQETPGEPKKKRGGILLIIGAIVLIIGIVVTVIGGASLGSAAVGLTQGLSSISVPGETSLESEADSTWSIYSGTAAMPEGVTLTVTGPDGAALTTGSPETTEALEVAEYIGTAVMDFEAAEAGTYVISTELAEGATAPTADFFVGRSLTDFAMGAVGGVGGLCGGVVVALIGLILLIIGLVLRLKS